MSYSAATPQYQLYPVDQFRGDGIKTVFTLTQNVLGNNSILVWVDGLKLPTTSYNVNGDVLTLFVAPRVPGAGFISNIEVFYLNVQNQEGFTVSAVTSINAISNIGDFTFTGVPIASTGTIVLGFTGTRTALSVASGGTGQNTFLPNQLLLGNGTTTLATVPTIGALGQALTSQGAGLPPTFTNVVNSVSGGNTGLRYSTATPDLATGAAVLAGQLVVNNGGTGVNTLASNQLLLGNGVNPISVVPPGALGYSLVSGGLTSAPTWTLLPTADPLFGVGSLFLGVLPANTSVNPGGTFTATALAPITIYATGTGTNTSITVGTYVTLGAINATEEVLLWRTV